MTADQYTASGEPSPSPGERALPYPKIELHVHLEATVRPARLLEIARRNDVRLPARDEQSLRRFCRFSDFDHFIQVWIGTTQALRYERDFREILVDYAGEAAAQGCVYIEAIFSPSEPVARGSSWQEVFDGYCAGVEEARERHGVEVRLTPDITRNLPVETADQLVKWAVKYRERGVVGLSLGGSEHRYPPELFARPFAAAREGGLRAAPHAGEHAGPASVRVALDLLHAERLRHGVRAVEDRRFSPRSPLAVSSATLLPGATSVPELSAPWPSIRCRVCSRPGCGARFRRTTRC